MQALKALLLGVTVTALTSLSGCAADGDNDQFSSSGDAISDTSGPVEQTLHFKKFYVSASETNKNPTTHPLGPSFVIFGEDGEIAWKSCLLCKYSGLVFEGTYKRKGDSIVATFPDGPSERIAKLRVEKDAVVLLEVSIPESIEKNTRYTDTLNERFKIAN